MLIVKGKTKMDSKKLMPNLIDEHRNKKSANNAEMKREQFQMMVYFNDDTTGEMAKKNEDVSL